MYRDKRLGLGGLPLAFRLSEGLGRTQCKAGHLVFAVELATDPQEAALMAALHEPKLLVQGYCRSIPCVDANVYLAGT